MKRQVLMHLESVTTKFTVVLLYNLLGVTCNSEYDATVQLKIESSSTLNNETLPTLPDEKMTITQDGFSVFWFIIPMVCFVVLIMTVGITFGILLKKSRPTQVADLAE